MRLVLSVFFMLLFSIFSYSQVQINIADYESFVRDQNIRKNNSNVYDPRAENNFLGSPYLRDSFHLGEVMMRNNVKYTGVPLRYNIYLDELEFTGEDGMIWALSNPQAVQYVEMETDKLVYAPFLAGKKIKQTFFVVEKEGKATLLRKPKIFLHKAEKPGAYKDAKPPRFITRPDEYYLWIKGQAARHIVSKKELPELFPDHQKEVKTFVKKQKVKPNKPELLLRLVEYYNELIGEP